MDNKLLNQLGCFILGTCLGIFLMIKSGDTTLSECRMELAETNVQLAYYHNATPAIKEALESYLNYLTRLP